MDAATAVRVVGISYRGILRRIGKNRYIENERSSCRRRKGTDYFSLGSGGHTVRLNGEEYQREC